MIIDEIALRNFGVYLGNQVIPLTPPSKAKSIILFGGLNGSGKTTFLDALQLVFFGRMAHCSNRGRLAYNEFLKRSVNKSVDPQIGAGIKAKFRHISNGKEHRYTILREWRMNGTRLHESVRVEKDDNYDAVITKTWEEQVEQFIPLQISNLFFFDGEKVQELAQLKKSAALLKTGIYSLLGLNLVDQLKTDLAVLEKRKKEDLKAVKNYDLIEIDKKEIRKIEDRKEDIVQKQGAVQNELDRLNHKLDKLEGKFRLEGGELYKKRETIKNERDHLADQVKNIKDVLREISAGATPLMLVWQMLDSIEKQAYSEESSLQAKLFNKIIRERDKMLIKRLRSRRTPLKSVDAVESILSEDREKRDLAETAQVYLKLADEDRETIAHLRKAVLPEIKTKVDLLLENLSKTEDSLNQVDQTLALIPDEGALSTLIDAIEETRQTRKIVETELAVHRSEYEKLYREIEFKQARLIKRIDAAVDEAFEQEDLKRILHHSQRVRKTLDKFRLALVRRHINRIQQFVLESFEQLFRKKTLVKDIKINPESFALKLIGSNGEEFIPDRLSAGERQLIAVSLLWGLARASERSLPAIIDTPLGRLDASHRTYLIERYFPYASHQVILLSTDEEISAKHFKKLQPWIGRSYQLVFDDSTEATTVRPGYFQ